MCCLIEPGSFSLSVLLFFIGEQVTHFAAVMQSADRSENKAERINWIDFTLTYAEVLLQNAVISRRRGCILMGDAADGIENLNFREFLETVKVLFTKEIQSSAPSNSSLDHHPWSPKQIAHLKRPRFHSEWLIRLCTGDDFEQFRSISVTVKRPRILS